MLLLRAALILVFSVACAAQTGPIALELDASEAEIALRIVQKNAAHQAVSADEWDQLFRSTPYQWLKEREASMKRAFTDEQFREFLLSPESATRIGEWTSTLASIRQADTHRLAESVLEWLPPGASIRARVFPLIKPMHNSFVWTKEGSGPAIFLYLEKQTKDQFENTVAHECHHIGLRSLTPQIEKIIADLPPSTQTAVAWMGAFGEGAAMLAAAGSADRHPHWEDDGVARARWDSDMTHFNADIGTLEQFFTDILDGKLKDQSAARERAAPFWGYQGAWYTVGYEMSALVEKQFGRKAFTDTLLDSRKLLSLYNKVAQQANAKGETAPLTTWSAAFLERLNGH